MHNFPIQTFGGHCYALKTGLELITYHVPITLAVKKDFSYSIEGCSQIPLFPQSAHFLCRVSPPILTENVRIKRKGVEAPVNITNLAFL